MEAPARGSVTPLSSMFSPEEALSAVKRVQDSISDYNKELDHVSDFIAENRDVINLVQRLPDELHHDIMVPFGKAAFFPGQLIHTNEFLVLLGEGYYAERTSKQTVEILNKRGKVLESQVESLNAMVQDLKAEATFFDTTASEAAEGLVEIRDEYIEEGNLPETFSNRGISQKSAKSRLHEVCATNYWKPPNFECCEEDGPTHLKPFTFKVVVTIEEAFETIIVSYGEPALTKKAAAEHAAEGVLWYLSKKGYFTKNAN